MRVSELISQHLHSRRRTSLRRPYRAVNVALVTASAVCLCILAGVDRSWGQEAPEPERIFPSLYRTHTGWFGVDNDAETDRLLLFDSTFRELGQTQWLDLNPLDFVLLPSPWGDSAALLLAQPSGATVLFRVRMGRTPDLQPIWQVSGSPYNRIVAVRNPVLRSSPEITLAGDSGLTTLQLDGTQSLMRSTRLLTTIYSGGTELITIERFGSAISVIWLDLVTGNVLASRPLDSGGEVFATMQPSGPGESNVIVVTSNPPSLFRFRNKTRGFEEKILLTEFPDALLALDAGVGTALLFEGYPSPRVQIVGPTSSISEMELYYPGRTLFSDHMVDGRYILLVGKDSAAVYNRSLEYLCSVPTAGGTRPRLIPLNEGGDRYVLATDAGSRLVDIEELSLLWLRQTWPYILGAVLLVTILLIGRSAYRRYRFIRAVYANLVQAPGSAGVVVTSGRGRVLRINHSARLFLDIEAPVPLGRHVSSYLQAEELRPVLDSVRRLLATGEPFEIELMRTLSGGQRTLRFQGRIMYGRYGGASGYILLIEDITASIERDRLVNWASVAHHIAHEMKTPLGTVRTTAELLREGISRHPEPEKVAPALQRIIRQSIRLREIVDDLLTVARTESLNRMDTNVSMLLSSLIDEFSEYLPATIRLRYETRGADFRGLVDPDQLTIAVRNLLDNARQAIGERESGQITLTLHGEPERLRVVVEDNGIGMSRKTLDRLFQPYYTEKEGGSGIGTIIVKRVVEGHGGTVEVESEQGIGTMFILKLPREA